MNKIEVIQQKIIDGNIDDISQLQIVEAVEEFLLKQNRASLYQNKCAYRGDNELKCAVGCLIPDPYYQQDMEDKGVEHLATAEINPKLRSFINRFIYVLGQLQSIHDSINISYWKESINNLKKSLDNRLYM